MLNKLRYIELYMPDDNIYNDYNLNCRFCAEVNNEVPHSGCGLYCSICRQSCCIHCGNFNVDHLEPDEIMEINNILEEDDPDIDDLKYVKQMIGTKWYCPLCNKKVFHPDEYLKQPYVVINDIPWGVK